MVASHAAYRADIDGLRAVAVSVVLLFHAFPESLPGGFVGVDIFFVISGYLITSILVREANDGRFSIINFYIRRAKRIFPALLLVLASSAIIGWAMLLPKEWQQLGSHEFAGAMFISNIKLWRESGYFDSQSELKILLHLWTLAIEEQFYLLWPLVVFVGVRLGSVKLIGLTIGLCVSSLLASAMLTPKYATLSFFLPATRFWELLSGSGLAIVLYEYAGAISARFSASAAYLLENVLGLVGAGCIIASVLLFSSATEFPGYLAIFPVFGSAAVIAAGPKAVANRWFLGNPVAVRLGLISYPLYLWHWPLLALSRIWNGGEVSANWRSLMLVLACLLAWMTYRWVEKPVRAHSQPKRDTAVALNLWIALISLGLAGVAAWTGVIAPRSAKSVLVRRITAAQSDWIYKKDLEWRGGRSGRVLFVGDSHMQHYAARIAAIMSEQRDASRSASFVTEGGCAPIPGITRKSVDCASFMQRATQAMRAADVSTVVLAASWVGFSQRGDYYRIGDSSRQTFVPMTAATGWVLDQWADQLSTLVRSGKRVVIVLSSPRGPLVDPVRMIDRSVWSWDEKPVLDRSLSELKNLVSDVDKLVMEVALTAGAEFVDPFPSFCRMDVCGVVTDGGDPIFSDDSHIRASFARDRILFLDRYLLGE